MADEETLVDDAPAEEAAEDTFWEESGTPPEEAGPVSRETSAEAPAPAAKPVAAPAEGWAAFLKEGETHEKAIERLGTEAKQHADRAARHYHDKKRLEETFREGQQRLERMEATYKRWVDSFEAEERKKLEAQLPDPELEPERATLQEVRGLRERLDADKAEAAENARRAAAAGEQARQAEALQAVDNAAFQEAGAALGLVEGVEGDEEFKQVWADVEAQRWRQLSFAYPDATDDQKMEGIEMLRVIDARKAAMSGTRYTDYIRRMHAAVFGAPAATAAAARRNGKPGTPTVQDLEKAAARASRAAGMRRAPAGGGIKPPPTLEDLAKLDETAQARVLAEAAKKGDDLESELWLSLADEKPYGG